MNLRSGPASAESKTCDGALDTPPPTHGNPCVSLGFPYAFSFNVPMGRPETTHEFSQKRVTYATQVLPMQGFAEHFIFIANTNEYLRIPD